MPFSLISFFPFTLPSPPPSLPPSRWKEPSLCGGHKGQETAHSHTHPLRCAAQSKSKPEWCNPSCVCRYNDKSWTFTVHFILIPTPLPFQQEFFVYPSGCQETRLVRLLTNCLWSWRHINLSGNCVHVFSVERCSVCSLLTGAAPSATVSGEEEDPTGESL